MGTADYVAKLLKSGSVNDIFKLTGLAGAWFTLLATRHESY